MRVAIVVTVLSGAALGVVFLLVFRTVAGGLEEFFGLVAAFELGEDVADAVKMFLDDVTDAMIEGLPDELAGPARALVDGARRVSSFLLALPAQVLRLLGDSLERLRRLFLILLKLADDEMPGPPTDEGGEEEV